jgi:ERF superfamily
MKDIKTTDENIVHQLKDDKTIHQQLIDLQSDIDTVLRDKKNPFFKSTYATLDSIQKMLREPLIKNNLGYYQITTPEGLKTVIFNGKGDEITNFYPIALGGLKAQEIGSATTYARRYSLASLFSIIIEEDDDGEATRNKGTGFVDEAAKIKIIQAKLDNITTMQEAISTNIWIKALSDEEKAKYNLEKALNSINNLLSIE